MEPLKKDQKVQLRVVKLSGTVLAPRGKENEKEDEGRAVYTVHFPEQTLVVRRENLVPIPDPDPNPAPAFGTKEWATGFERFKLLLTKWEANPNDRINLNELIKLGATLGYFMPIEQPTQRPW
jgi:hypothetical protein